MVVHHGVNHLDARSIDVASLEGDLEVVPRLGYLKWNSFLFCCLRLLFSNVAGSVSFSLPVGFSPSV